MKRYARAFKFTIVTAAMITQWAAAEFKGVGGQTPQAPTGAPAPAAPSWGTKFGCNPLRAGETQPRCWDDRLEAVVGADRGNPPEVSRWLKRFDMVVVIEKRDQTETAYVNQTGDKGNVQLLKIVDEAKISSGANDETRDCDNQYAPRDAQGVRWVTATEKESIYRHSPTGYFVVRALKADYWSRKYGSQMQLAVAIDEDEGIYNHVHPEGTEGWLGTKASHGCFREDKKQAAHIFAAVAVTGGPIDPADDSFRAHCWKGKEGNDACDVDQRRDLDLQNYARELAQGKITGFNVDKPKSPIDLRGKLPRPAPYTENDRPDVLVVHKNGLIEVDPQTGGPKTSRNAYNTLYIVKDSTKVTDTPFVPPPQIECTVQGENAKIVEKYRLAGKTVYPPTGTTASSNIIGDFFSGRLFPQPGEPRPSQPVRPARTR